MTEGSKIQYFTLFRTLSLPYQFYHCPRNFFPSSYYHFSTSFFEAFKVTFISFPPTTLSADLLTALLLCCCSKKGLTKMPFKFFFLVRTLMERRLAPFLPGRLSWCPAVKCCGRTTKTTTQWNALQFPSAKLFWLLNRFYSSRQSGTFHSCRPSPAGLDRLNSSCHSRSAAFPLFLIRTSCRTSLCWTHFSCLKFIGPWHGCMLQILCWLLEVPKRPDGGQGSALAFEQW